MSLSYTYNGAAFEGSVPPSSLSPTQMADGGQAAFGGLVVDDAAAEILTVGHKAFTVEESDCSQPRLFTGWTTERDMARSVERGMIVGDDRLHDVTLIDLNALFNFRQISGTAADRPEESWGDRLAWILASDFLDGLIADTGFVMAAPPAWECDAADYRGQYPSAVLNDLLEVSNTYELTYFAFWDPAGTATSLFLGAKDSCIGTSTLSISNDASEYDGTACFFPSEDTILARKPDQVFSEVTVNYRSGTKRLFRSRTSIASNFIRRGTNYDVPRVYSDAAASIVATAFLNRHSYEIDLITTTIRVPKASAGLVQAGQRINVKFTHLPGYTTTTSMRVVECTPVPIDDLAAYYDIRLVLELPKPGGGGESETDCPDPTPAGTWYPLGGSGNTPNATVDGYIIYGNGGELYTYCEPDPGFVGEWHFPAYGAGGEGTYDYAGSLAENFIRIPLIGPGSLTFVSKAYSATDVPLIWTVNWCDGGDIHQYSSGGITAGGSVTVAVPASDDLCGWFFQIGDNGPGGTKWGWASATWATGADDAEEDQGFPPGSTLGETPDVNIGTPSDGDVLVYDSDSGTWGASPVVGSLVSVSDGITTVAPTSYLTVPANSLTDGGGAEAVLAYVTPAYGGQETLSIGTASGTAFTIDIADGNVHDLTLGSDCTLTFTGATANVACSFTMLLRQDGTGGWEVTWPAELEWSGGTAPTLDTTASTVTALAFFTVDGGTSWYGFAGSGGGGSGDVATDTIWDALGDIAVGTAANAAAVLSVGTDGYVLTADSGEALGVKWAAAAGGGAVATDTIWDAKGDIAIGTAANAAAVLGVGTDGYVLTADSGEATGVKWAAGSGGIADMGEFTYLDATGTAAPGTPAPNYARIYAKNGRVYSLDSTGTEYGPFDAAGGGPAGSEPYDTLGVGQQYPRVYTSTQHATADKAIYIPLVVADAMTAKKLFYVTGGTTTGTATVELAIYDEDGVQLATSGTASYNTGNNNTFTVRDITDTPLAAGLYYLAITCSIAASGVQFIRYNTGTNGLPAWGCFVQASALALPGTATFAWATTEASIPLIGILARSEIT